MLREEKIILDLCAGSGEWSKPYEQAGYRVERYDLPHGDVRFLKARREHVYGILAAPPCTVFAASGARWKRSLDEMALALSIVDACLRAVIVHRPRFWALENPVGKLRSYLGKPALSFQPCDFGDPYTKKTLLWGEFNRPAPRIVFPWEGSKLHRLGKSKDRAAKRSVTPAGFARAFFEANQ